MVQKNISIPEKQAVWLKENCVSLSKLVQRCIAQEMKSQIDSETGESKKVEPKPSPQHPASPKTGS